MHVVVGDGVCCGVGLGVGGAVGPGCGGCPVCASHSLLVAVAVCGSFLMAGHVLGCFCPLALVVLFAHALPVLVWRWNRLGVGWCRLGLVRCCLCVLLVDRRYVRRRLYGVGLELDWSCGTWSWFGVGLDGLGAVYGVMELVWSWIGPAAKGVGWELDRSCSIWSWFGVGMVLWHMELVCACRRSWFGFGQLHHSNDCPHLCVDRLLCDVGQLHVASTGV